MTVAPPPGGPDPATLLAHLARASGWLRAEVAAAITRRKAPGLSFRVAFPEENGPVRPPAAG